MYKPAVAKGPRVPSELRRAQIIDAAIELFSASGFAGTTTRRIAEAAGVSEAALYLHFETKEALYEAIIRRKAVASGDLGEQLRTMIDQPPRVVFAEVARFMLETHTRDKAFLRLLLYSGLEQHALFRMFHEAQVRECGETLLDYVADQQRRGAFRAGEPRLVVRAFMGMLFHHLLVQEVFQLTELGVYPPEEAAPQFVGIFLDGITNPDASEAGAGELACG